MSAARMSAWMVVMLSKLGGVETWKIEEESAGRVEHKI